MRARPPAVVTETDFRRLTSLLATPLARANEARAHALAAELARARVIAADTLPPDVVTMNSRVEYCDDSRRPSELALVYPWDAAPSRGEVSVLAPLGTALLGLRVGTTIDWEDPSGRVHCWTVLGLPFQPEALGFVHL